MKKGWLKGFLAAGLAAGSVMAAETPKAQGKTMAAGRYSASVTALVCGACVDEVVQTLKECPGIEGVLIDAVTKRVEFAVKAGGKVRTADLQQRLKAASDKMGMGADYTLKDLKKASKPVKN